MSTKEFTAAEIYMLSNNIYIKKGSGKGISTVLINEKDYGTMNVNDYVLSVNI
ncbi:hypothetical protein LL033_07785 [Clostridium estertheticum]|uniref:hypothetical protein n=1 Tax=Clostridium estertheticum TaxID=238834 RepID=UPI001C0D8F1F|nr:hypothetical protein [Clostridium estertheticum]MBU3074807.1 hypothetical protein [Clostridium estertheticum]MBU3165022.1 hypothetical protein [Clostridium estertheticum]MBU3214711.1 hypothetical protein [Clostridium estertheticum]WAG57123.1 hypothetical protein LL033_07785 [Clostridium estertheticum]